jgi:hypothetical protein
VSGGEPIDPDAVLVSIDASAREAYLGGAKAPFGEVRDRFPASKNPEAPGWLPRFIAERLYQDAGETRLMEDPVLLELRPETVFRDQGAVFQALVGNGWTNVSFLVETPDGPRAVAWPIPCFARPGISRGGRVWELPPKADRIWVVAAAAPGGRPVVKEILQGPKATRRVLEGCVISDLPSLPWGVDHPAFGPWTEEEFRSFLACRAVAPLDPVVVLRAAGEETAADVIACLIDLRGIAGDRLVLEVEPRFP